MRYWFWIVMCVVLITGCGKVNGENYARLRVGMNYGEVVAILGKADDCDAVLGARSCVWQSGKKRITVQLMGDKVLLFSAEGL